MSYEIVAGSQNDARVRVPVQDKVYTPQEISAMVLQKLKKDAEAYLGECDASRHHRAGVFQR